VFSQDYTYKDLFSVSFRLDISEKRVPYELNIFFLQQYLCDHISYQWHDCFHIYRGSIYRTSYFCDTNFLSSNVIWTFFSSVGGKQVLFFLDLVPLLLLLFLFLFLLLLCSPSFFLSSYFFFHSLSKRPGNFKRNCQQWADCSWTFSPLFLYLHL